MNGIAKRKVNDLVLDFILNMILLIGVISLFNLARYLLKIRKLIKGKSAKSSDDCCIGA